MDFSSALFIRQLVPLIRHYYILNLLLIHVSFDRCSFPSLFRTYFEVLNTCCLSSLHIFFIWHRPTIPSSVTHFALLATSFLHISEVCWQYGENCSTSEACNARADFRNATGINPSNTTRVGGLVQPPAHKYINTAPYGCGHQSADGGQPFHCNLSPNPGG